MATGRITEAVTLSEQAESLLFAPRKVLREDSTQRLSENSFGTVQFDRAILDKSATMGDTGITAEEWLTEVVAHLQVKYGLQINYVKEDRLDTVAKPDAAALLFTPSGETVLVVGRSFVEKQVEYMAKMDDDWRKITDPLGLYEEFSKNRDLAGTNAVQAAILLVIKTADDFLNRPKSDEDKKLAAFGSGSQILPGYADDLAGESDCCHDYAGSRDS